MEHSETLKTLYTAPVEQSNGTYQITLPGREITSGTLAEAETYRIALISTATSHTETIAPASNPGADHDEQQPQADSPPVVEGERRNVEIEHLGDQGDGIAKVEHGYVVIVPDTTVGDRVTVEIQQVRDNVAFAEVVDRHPRSAV